MTFTDPHSRLMRSVQGIVLWLSQREFNRAIHDIKKQIEGNPDLVFDIISGDVYDQRSGEWIGNLLDD